NWFRQIPGVSDELVETFIEEGFLSYDDLTYLEPAQLGELAGITEDQAEDMIAFAEEAAERVEEESRAARAAEAEAEAATEGAPRAVPLRRGSTPRPADLFPEDGPPPPVEARPTLESLFGPDAAAPAATEEKSLHPDEVFGTQAPPSPS